MATSGSGIKLGSGWQRLRAAIHPSKFKSRLEREVGRATLLNARIVARAFRQEIRGGSFAANAPLTIALKGSSKPLVADAELWKAIVGVAIDWKTGFAGILRQARRASGTDLFNLAVGLHDGMTVPVTPAMRGLFFSLAAVTRGEADPSSLSGRAAEIYETMRGSEIRPLADTTTHILIPGRPFIEQAWNNPGLKAILDNNWSEAVQRALTPPGGGSGSGGSTEGGSSGGGKSKGAKGGKRGKGGKGSKGKKLKAKAKKGAGRKFGAAAGKKIRSFFGRLKGKGKVSTGAVRDAKGRFVKRNP